MARVREEPEIEIEEYEIVGNCMGPGIGPGRSYGYPSALNPRAHI